MFKQALTLSVYSIKGIEEERFIMQMDYDEIWYGRKKMKNV